MSEERIKIVELFNEHQEYNRKRTEFLSKSIFLLSGGALTFSMTFFLDKSKNINLTQEMICILKTSWNSLFISMGCFLMVITVMITRDYIFGEKWRKSIETKNSSKNDYKTLFIVSDVVMWIFGITGVLSFFSGFYYLSVVSKSLL